MTVLAEPRAKIERLATEAVSVSERCLGFEPSDSDSDQKTRGLQRGPVSGTQPLAPSNLSTLYVTSTNSLPSPPYARSTSPSSLLRP